MAGQLIPPPELAPPSVKHLTFDQKVKLWMDLVSFNEKMLVAGLRHRIGPDGDLRAACREWVLRQSDEKEREWTQLLKNLAESEAECGD